jgi:hypothetical protein
LSVDSILKNVAYETTIDSLSLSGLSTITPSVSQAGNTLTVIGYQNCSWFFNGSPYASNNCTINMNQSGKYYAIVTDQNNCEFQSLENTYLTTNVIENEIDKININFYPNPANDLITLNIEVLENFHSELRIYNAMGILVKYEKIKLSQNKIDVADLSNGIYLIVIDSKEFSKGLKLLIQR